jgi:hypothetical protein
MVFIKQIIYNQKLCHFKTVTIGQCFNSDFVVSGFMWLKRLIESVTGRLANSVVVGVSNALEIVSTGTCRRSA